MIQFFKDLFLKDLPLKLVSLALAIALWAAVSSVIEKDGEERFVTMSSNRQFKGVPVEVVSVAGDATGYAVKPPRVNVFIQGTPEAIRDFDPSSLRVIAELSDWDGRGSLPLPIRVITPAGTAVVWVSPAEVEVIPPAVPSVKEPPLEP